jgi:hypothetical protein
MRHDADPIECASLPASLLAGLSDLRRDPGVTVTLVGDRAWVRWDSASSMVLDRIRPIAGAELYSRRGGLWHRLGHRLPSFGLPVDDGAGMPIHRVVTPLPVQPEPPGADAIEPVGLTLVPDDMERPATAVECELVVLGRWAEMATSASLGTLRVSRSGDRALVLGGPLPPLAGGLRFWGRIVLIPLGMRPEPELPEAALCAALGAGDDGLLLLKPDGAEVVPPGAFRPLTRAGIRLALEGRTP